MTQVLTPIIADPTHAMPRLDALRRCLESILDSGDTTGTVLVFSYTFSPQTGLLPGVSLRYGDLNPIRDGRMYEVVALQFVPGENLDSLFSRLVFAMAEDLPMYVEATCHAVAATVRN